MSDDIEYAWEAVHRIIKPAKVTRLALRYLNRFERSAPDQLLSYWLKPTDYVPSAALNSLPVFSANVSVRLSEKDRLNVGVTDQISPIVGHGGFLFDIDRISEDAIVPEIGGVAGKLNQLHESVWDVFNAAKGNNLEKLLKGEIS